MKQFASLSFIVVTAFVHALVHRPPNSPTGTVVMAGTEVPDYSYLAELERRHMALRTPISWARAAWQAVSGKPQPGPVTAASTLDRPPRRGMDAAVAARRLAG